jgi:hypothetical protein
MHKLTSHQIIAHWINNKTILAHKTLAYQIKVICLVNNHKMIHRQINQAY